MKLYLLLALLVPSWNIIYFDTLFTGIKSSSILNLAVIIYAFWYYKISISTYLLFIGLIVLAAIYFLLSNLAGVVTVLRYLELAGMFTAGLIITKNREVNLVGTLRLICIPLGVIIACDLNDFIIPLYPNIEGGWIKGHVSGPFALNYQLGLALASVALIAANPKMPHGPHRGLLIGIIGVIVYAITLSRATLLGFVLIAVFNILSWRFVRSVLATLATILALILLTNINIAKVLEGDHSLAFRYRLWDCIYSRLDFFSILFGHPEQILLYSNSCVDSVSLSAESLQIRFLFNHGLVFLALSTFIMLRYVTLFLQNIKLHAFNERSKSLALEIMLPLEFLTFAVGYSLFLDGLITSHAGAIFWLLFGAVVGFSRRKT